jgi:NAD(P)-dependent dehydrogenase (short-subunit alcohol dehydrogenase family)
MGKAVLVTGAAQRIGKAIALGLAEDGFDIALHYNSSMEKAEKLHDEILARGVHCEMLACDFSSMTDVSSFMDTVFEIFPHCCLLINNAAIFERAFLMETDEDIFDRHITINFKTPFFLTRDFARLCKEGQIINIVDTKITESFTPYFAYTLSKKALFELTLMSAKELAPHIRVNAVAPGPILPPRDKDREYFERLGKKTPLKKAGQPKQVVNAIKFLIENSYITGECIFVDGGEHIK